MSTNNKTKSDSNTDQDQKPEQSRQNVSNPADEGASDDDAKNRSSDPGAVKQ
jgi:hypothetical protein